MINNFFPLYFQPINLISGSSYEQVQSKDGKFNGEKMSSGMVRKGIQAHPDGKFVMIFIRDNNSCNQVVYEG